MAYLAALFGVAFVVVLISLIIQINQNGTGNSTSADKVMVLQSQVQQLQREKAEIEQEKTELQNALLEIQEGVEFIEGTAQEATGHITAMEMELSAVRRLMDAQYAIAHGDDKTLVEAMADLEELYKYLTVEDQYFYYQIQHEMNTENQE